MLDSQKFSEAVQTFLKAKRSVSYNIMVAGEGIAVDLEAHPEDVSLIYPSGQVLAHTNHFIGKRSYCVKDKFLLDEPSSINRYMKSLDMMMSVKKHSLDTVKNVLTDHYDHPTSICYHSTPEQNQDYQEETISSIIMVPEKRLFMATYGPPCSNEYYTIPFENPL